MADLSAGDGTWFAALPDCAAAQPAAQSLIGPDTRVLRHPSGRPWLLGGWPEGEVRVAEAGPVRLAVVGCCAASDAALTELAGRATRLDPVGLCAAAVDLAGSFHLVASLDGQVVARGSASGTRRLFHARLGPVTVLADRARLVARRCGAGLDDAALAAALLAPSAPYPLHLSTLWHQVTAVPPDHCVTIVGERPVRTARWWVPPEPGTPLAVAAPRVRAALRAAVAVRAGAAGVLSADLSGGMDSTSLCFLAAEAAAPQTQLVTLRVATTDRGSDDPVWADRAAGRLAGAKHLVVDPAEVLAAPVDVTTATEEPAGGLMTHALVNHTARLLAELGSRRHLAGYGGDEVFGVSRVYLLGLLRRQPRRAVAHLRAHRSLRRWPLAATLRALTTRQSYPAWLTRTAADLHEPRPAAAGPQFGWGATVRLPPWATTAAVDLVRDRLLAAADQTAGLARDRAQHRAVASIWSAAQNARQIGGLMAAAGLSLAVPFLDDQVINETLAVDLADRGTPWRYKPLLAEAVRPVVPAGILDRRTKAIFAADGMVGLRQHRSALIELCDGSVLARRGLVDAAALRAACVGLDPSGRTLMAVESTMAMELWLRAVEQEGVPR